jgi:hypothetical protein
MLFRETWDWYFPYERKSEGSQGTEEAGQPLSEQKTEPHHRSISKPTTSGCNRR